VSYEAKDQKRRRPQAWPGITYPLPMSPTVWNNKRDLSRAAVLENLIAKKHFLKGVFSDQAKPATRHLAAPAKNVAPTLLYLASRFPLATDVRMHSGRADQLAAPER
jgi:hypothetical protein